MGAAVGGADDLDFPPADSAGRLASLQRLVDRLLGGEPHRHVGGRVRTALTVGALGRREQALEDARSLIGDDCGNAGHLDQIDTDPDRGHGPRRAPAAEPRGRTTTRPTTTPTTATAPGPTTQARPAPNRRPAGAPPPPCPTHTPRHPTRAL